MSTLHEECGVFGVFASETRDVAEIAYYGLFALQHRGQESCGIVVNDDGLFTSYKDVGLVGEVFTPALCAPSETEIWRSATAATAQRGARTAQTPSRLS